ncbi:hypothetical protein [Idiomarina sp.]|uniref:hypothetical protein n=1 Tax=Idiomarina sp. TaxID=1874361 RepID=UPI003A9555B5
MKTFLLITAVSAFLIGCSSAIFNTNLEPYAKNKYRMIAVKEYSFQQMITFQAESLGGVSANYCQQNLEDPKANQSAIIDNLKTKVYQRGGNGLVVEQCRSSKYRSCESYIECYGSAYNVPED